MHSDTELKYEFGLCRTESSPALGFRPTACLLIKPLHMGLVTDDSSRYNCIMFLLKTQAMSTIMTFLEFSAL